MSELALGWASDYGAQLSPDRGLTQLREWSALCRNLALARIGRFPVWKGRHMGVDGQVVPAHIESWTSPKERIWPEIWHYTPLRDTMFVMRIPPEELTKGGLVIPETSQPKNHKGWILNISLSLGENPDCPTENPLDLVGQTVCWGEYAGRVLAETALDERWDGEYLQISLDEVLNVQTERKPNGHEEEQ